MIFEGVKIKITPDYYVPSAVNTIKVEPVFKYMDNPSQWSRYFYMPKFKPKGGKNFVHRALPTCARPVPVKEEGKWKCGAWGFHYELWKNSDKNRRRGSTTSNLFSEEIWVELDEDVLTALGLNADQMKTCDALFFFQVLW